MGYEWNGATAINEDVYMRAILFGDAKLGKTTIAATFPDPFVIANTYEDGHLVLMGHNIDVYVADSWDDMAAKVGWFVKHSERGDWYKTLVIDGLSFFTIMLLEGLGDRKDPRQLYQQLSKEIRGMVDAIHQKNRKRFHVVYTCHQVTNEEQDDKGKTRTVSRDLLVEGRKWMKLMPAVVDCQGYVKGVVATDGGDAKRVIRTELAAGHGINAGMRFRGLPSHMDNMDFPKLQAAALKTGVRLGGVGRSLAELLKVNVAK